MKKLKLTALLSLLFIFSYSSVKAQTWRIQTATISNAKVDSCLPTTVVLNAFLGCINWQVRGITSSISGSTINVDFNCISSPICAGAISNPTDSIVLQNLPVGTYTVNGNAILDNNLSNSVSLGTLVINPCITTSVDEIALASNYKIYPNPTNGLIYIENPKNIEEVVQYELIDLRGRAVVSDQFFFKTQRNSIQLNQIPSGIYYLKIKGKVLSSISKIVIQ